MCDDDHEEEYMSYKVNPNDIDLTKYKDDVDVNLKFNEIRIKDEERDNHVLIDDNGVKKKVRTYDKTEEMKDTRLRLIIYQPTQNFECFVFSIFNQDHRPVEESSNQNEQRSIVRKSYFFITKTSEQMRAILKSKAQKPIISSSDDIYLLKSYRCLYRTQIS